MAKPRSSDSGIVGVASLGSVRSRRPGFGRYQDAVAPIWRRLMGGCEPNRETLKAIEAAGLRIERGRGFGFPPAARAYPVVPRILGVARR